jgi:hypothetical protein
LVEEGEVKYERKGIRTKGLRWSPQQIERGSPAKVRIGRDSRQKGGVTRKRLTIDETELSRTH